jgi:hypothetical protein
MKLEKIEIIEPYPAINIPELDALVIADLHLGYEGIMAEQGVFIPKTQFKEEMLMLHAVLENKKVSRIVLCGDVKHEFSETSYHEFIEVTELFKFLRENFHEIILLKGNHDNYIVRVTKRYGIKLYDELELGDFYFLHGHRMPKDLAEVKAKHVIMAHEHPAIMLHDEVGGREKIDCFLHGKLGERGLLVLPAFSTLAEGSQINVTPSRDLLSPILKELVNVDQLGVIGISPEVGCLKFPEIGKLRVWRKV